MGALPKNEDAAQAAVSELEADILLGRLYPRERLTEEALSGRFGLKRHTVRQVLGELETAGLVVREAGRSAAVREYTCAEVRQLYDLREILEREAAMRITLPVSPADHAALIALAEGYADAVAAGDLLKVIRTNKRFHEVVYDLSGNAFLSEAIKRHMAKANLVRFATSTDPVGLAQRRDEHFAIVEALTGSDNDHLAALCIAHMQPSLNLWLERRKPLF